MQTKIIFILLILIAFIVALFQRSKIKNLNNEIAKAETIINSIQKKNELNIIDLQNRNQELINRNEELKLLFNNTKNISKKANENDCINQPINIDIVKLLQKAGI